MKWSRFIGLICMAASLTGYAQKGSKGDQRFFEYDYKGAIQQYELESRKAPLTYQQGLNLAEAYFKTRDYQKAADRYLAIFKLDSTLTNRHFNIMLQALSRTSGPDRARAFLSTRSDALTDELMENASFNYELLEENLAPSLSYVVNPLATNSAEDDYAPAFYDEGRLLFTSTRPLATKETYLPTGQAYADIYVGRIEAGGNLTQAAPLPWLPELPFHEATPFYSDALDAVFYVRSNAEDGLLTFDENGKNTLNICMAGANGTFKLLLRDPSTSFYYPFYDQENERLYFAADFQQGYGGTDLYYVLTNQGQIMSAPVNLGPRINTPGNEIAPFIQDGSLYFASDVFYGLGGMDVYKSQSYEDGSFSIPANLGPGINSTADDFGFIIRPSAAGGYEGYLASNRPGGAGGDDLYHFTVNDQPGLKTLVVRGTVLNTTAYGVEKAHVQLTDGRDSLLKETYTQENGTFLLEIPWHEDVRLKIDKERFTSARLGGPEDQGLLTSAEPLRVELMPVEAVVQQVRGETVLKGEKYYFAKGSARLTPEITAVLDEAARYLTEFPAMRIRVEAHTDSRGSTEANATLSQQRADAIRNYLLSKGVAPESIPEAVGLGESQIINHCTDGVYCLEVLHKQNERYPLVVLNYDSL